MKKLLSLMPLTMALIVLVPAVIFCVYGIYEINLTLNELANDLSSSGIDYLGVGWGYGIGLFTVSTLGLVLSIVSTKLLKQKIQRYLSIASTSLFVLLMIISICLFYV